MNRSCIYCGSTEAELRPYGPNGADICFSCMKASPERQAVARERLGMQLMAPGELVLVPDEQAGPRPPKGGAA